MSFHVILTTDSEKFEGSISTKLNKEICLRGDWEVALVQSNLLMNDSEDLFVYCDLIDYTYHNENRIQLLSAYKYKNYEKMYVRLLKKRFSSINMDLRTDLSSEIYPPLTDNSYFILHFRKL